MNGPAMELRDRVDAGILDACTKSYDWEYVVAGKYYRSAAIQWAMIQV